MSEPMVLGIDLGTTNSVVAVADGQRVRVLLDEQGNRLIPSVVSFHPQGDVLVGYPARERRLIDAENTIYSVKRLIGRSWGSEEVRRAQERFAFKLASGPNGGVLVQARGESFTLPEISAFVLREVRRIAEVATGQECTRAVVTVPANFNELQRAATKAAGKVAGLDVLRILNEPTAAALAYGYGKGTRERVAIFDLGGGTFDVTILELAGDLFEVLSTAGDTFLGGDDIDLTIAERMADTFLRQHRIDLRTDHQAFERLRAAAEWAKCQLSAENDVSLRVEELAYGPGGVALDLTFSLTRAELDELIGPLVRRAFDVCEDAMRTAMIRPTQLDNVILVGGSTRIPLVRTMVGDYFGREPLGTIDPDLVVAQGAALHAYALRTQPRGAGAPAPSAPVAKVALRKQTLVGLRTQEIQAETAQKRRAQPAFAPEPERLPQPAVTAPAPSAAPAGLFDGFEGPADEPTTIGPRPQPSARRKPPAASDDLPTSIGPAPQRPAARREVSAPAALPAAPPPRAAPQPPAPPAPASRPLAPKLPPLEGAVALGTVSITRMAAVGEVTPPAPPPPAPFPEARAPSSRPLAPASRPPPPPPPRAPAVSQGSDIFAQFDPAPVSPPHEAWPSTAAAQPQQAWPATAAAQPQQAWPATAAAQPQQAWPATAAAQPQQAWPATGEAQPQQAWPATGATQPHEAWPSSGAAQPQQAWPATGATQPHEAWPSSGPAQPASWAEAPALPPAPPAPRAAHEPWAPAAVSLPMPQAAAPLLLDVTPHSLGIETVGGYCEVVIRRNAAIPVEQTRVFATAQDDQETVEVRVLVGESRESKENQSLGRLELTGIRPAHRGAVRIAVTFVMGQDGTLAVEAKDTESGRAQSVKLQLVGSVTDAEVQRMAERQQSILGRSA